MSKHSNRPYNLRLALHYGAIRLKKYLLIPSAIGAGIICLIASAIAVMGALPQMLP